MPDALKVSLWVGIAAIVIGIGCLGAVAWANAGSRNLVLATSTLVGAALLFATQLPFELRSKTETDVFGAELTIDRAIPQIRQWKYPDHPDAASSRLVREAEASSFLAAHDRPQFDGDGEHLNRDLILYSFLAFFGTEQFDWQLKRTALHGTTFGSEIRTQRVSQDNECSWLSPQQLETQLVAAGNVFSRAPLWITGGKLCLPPGSQLRITEKSIAIWTPYCNITFTLEPSGGVSYMKPGSGGEAPQTENGVAQYETRLTGIRSVVELSWIRAQGPEMEKYADWSGRLVKGARLWFEGRVERTN